jgi:hypothetical protein
VSEIAIERFTERLQISLGQLDNGLWLAISDKDPCFCLEAETPEEALAAAGRAFAYSETVLRAPSGGTEGE